MLACFFRCFFGIPGWQICLILLVPMMFDGFLQLLTSYESTNPRRFVTGTLFGYGLMTLAIVSFVAMYRLGYRFGQQFL